MTTDCGAGAAAPLTVAVTGPTGDIGRSLLRVLDAQRPRGAHLGHGAAAV